MVVGVFGVWVASSRALRSETEVTPSGTTLTLQRPTDPKPAEHDGQALLVLAASSIHGAWGAPCRFAVVAGWHGLGAGLGVLRFGC